MRKVAVLALVTAGVSFILALIARVTLNPCAVLPGGIKPAALMSFTNTCLLTAIAFILLEIAKKK